MKRARRTKLMAEINITPFTDVVLVLLIIFMVTTPLILQSGIKVKLPQVETAETEDSSTVSVTVSANGEVYLEGKKYDFDNLQTGITARISSKPGTMLVIKADKEVKYDFVMKVLDIARLSGAKKYALATEVKANPLK
jgi:biopolymer transport protein ExbD